MRDKRELEILNAIAEALNSAADVRQALDRTLPLVTRLLNLDTGWVWLVDPDSGHFYNAASQNLPPYLQEPVRMTGASCWCIEEFRSGELTARNIDVMECSRLRPAVRASQTELTSGIAHHASIPLYFQDKPLGIMNITTRDLRAITDEELRLLSTIAFQLGVAIERARLAEDGARLARSEERARLAREIHDTLAQGLTGIALQIERAVEQMDDSPAEAKERLRQALKTTRENLDEARRSVLNLRAAPLASKPLAQALASLARSFTSDTGILVSFHSQGNASIPLAIEAELYRIAQESLHNVRQHSGARNVEIALATKGERVQLTISDDGSGIKGRPDAAGHHGLTGMRERASVIGGTFRIRSAPEGGTSVSVSAPLGSRS